MAKKIIFVIGAARSGTHLVASSINESLKHSQYIPEINEFWNKYNNNLKTDIIDIETLSCEKIKNKIRNEFFNLLDNRYLYHIEKTAANSLRVDLLIDLFPDAKFIHIVRDRESVVNSVLKKLSGDPRKITKNNKNKVSFYGKLLFIILAFKKKLKSNTLSLKYLIKNMNYYISILLSVFGLPNNGYWGPRFSAKKLNLNKKEYASAQWEYCVNKARKDLANTSHIEIYFNDLVSNPKEVSKKVSEYLWDEIILFNIDESILNKKNIVKDISLHTN